MRSVYWTINIKTDNAPDRPQGIPLFLYTFFKLLSWTEILKMNNKKMEFHLEYMCDVLQKSVCAIVQNWFYTNMKMENYKTNILPTKSMHSIANRLWTNVCKLAYTIFCLFVFVCVVTRDENSCNRIQQVKFCRLFWAKKSWRCCFVLQPIKLLLLYKK